MHVQVWNPSFDVTPAALITGIITEQGLVPKDLAGTSAFRVASFLAGASPSATADRTSEEPAANGNFGSSEEPVADGILGKVQNGVARLGAAVGAGAARLVGSMADTPQDESGLCFYVRLRFVSLLFVVKRSRNWRVNFVPCRRQRALSLTVLPPRKLRLAALW